MSFENFSVLLSLNSRTLTNVRRLEQQIAAGNLPPVESITFEVQVLQELLDDMWEVRYSLSCDYVMSFIRRRSCRD